MGKKSSSQQRGSLYYKDAITRNPTPTSFTDFKIGDELTLNPTPQNFDPSEHDDLTRNPTPQNFNVDLSPVHQLATSEPSYQPTNYPTTFRPTTSPTFKPTPTHSPTYEPTLFPTTSEPTYEPSLSPVKSANTGLVPDMRAIFPSWDLNAGATWTVVILFFLVMLGVLFLFVYNAFFKEATEKRRRRTSEVEETASNPMGEADPLLNTKPPKAPYFPFGVPKISNTMARVSTVHTEALKDFFASGKVLDLHTSKGKKTVELSLAGTDLRWKTINDIFPKKFKLDIKTVLSVEIGKKTDNFKKINVSDDLCLSLVSDKTTLDVEAQTKADRDIMAEGFTEMIENIKAKASSV